LLASLITYLFAGTVLLQYLHRRRLHTLVWAVALLCYGVATSAQFVAEAYGWSTAAFRIWYLTGGLLTAAFLGQGSALLLLPRRLARALLVLLIAASVVGTYRIAVVGLSTADILPPLGKVTPTAANLPADLRALAVILNIYGTLLLVGGAIWSAVVYVDHMLDRRRRAGYRVLSNLLIAGGAMIVASAGSLEALGHGEFLYLGEIAGISVIFAGFLCSRERMRFPWTRPTAGPAPVPESPGAAVMAGPSARSLRRIRDRTTTARR
jgi:hypothetical protein